MGRILVTILTIAVIGTPFGYTYAQGETGLKTHIFQLIQDTVIVDSLYILPSSIQFDSTDTSVIDWVVHQNTITIKKKSGPPAAMTLHYRTLSVDILRSSTLLDSSLLIFRDKSIPIEADLDFGHTRDRRLIQSGSLKYDGSFSRGIRFGNSQDVVLNSSFNMQMSGDLGNGLTIKAAISDENIPIQPEGNTQVLQEFDKVFIELSKNRTSVIAGDYELGKPDSYFINYFKKLKGLSVQNTSVQDGWTLNNRASYAVSRGKFNRIFLNTSEGNQGPYRLNGIYDEQFIIVLSGTEKVYLDGRQLTRGENHDYIIDYQRAELTFTSNLLIRTESRIIVEFEYTDQNYLRSLYTLESRASKGIIELTFNLYNEQDSKSATGNIELDSTDIRILTESGDDPLSAVRSGIFLHDDITTDDLIAYRFQNDSILVYDSEGRYGAIFSRSANNAGAYRISDNTGVNGRVYEYVGPGNGSYDPVIRLIAPEKKQILSLKTNIQPRDSTSFVIETSMSNNDRNRFSVLGNEDNIGLAVMAQFSDARKAGKQKLWELRAEGMLEVTDADFQALNPYRAVEFQRDWNIENLEDRSDEFLFSAGLKAEHSSTLTMSYGISGYSRGTTYKGIRHLGDFYLRRRHWEIQSETTLLMADHMTENNLFHRPRINLTRTFGNSGIKAGINFRKSLNRRVDTRVDTLLPLSQNYDSYRVFLEYAKKENLRFQLGVKRRNEDRILDDRLSDAFISDEADAGGTWVQGRHSNLSLNFTLRNFKVNPEFTSLARSKKSFLGKLDHKLNLLENGIKLQTFFESATGQEPKLEFQYVKVQTGQGTYTWNDYNQDSIPQVNEFVIAPYSDLGSYEKISVFNNEFLQTSQVVLNQNLVIEPRRFIKNKANALNDILSRMSLTTRYRIDQKSSQNEQGRLFQFIQFNTRDTNLVSYSGSFDQNIFFNRGNPHNDFQLSYRSLGSQFVQITGFEKRHSEEDYFRGRVNFKRRFDFIFESGLGQKTYDSENFDNQDFIVNYYRLVPQLNFRPSRHLRVIAKYTFFNGLNTIGHEEKLSTHDAGFELTWRPDPNASFQLRLNYIHNDFSGALNSAVGFELLQGLRNGSNGVWNVNFTKRLSNHIDLVFNYEGRKSRDSKMINTAGMQLRAIF